MDICLPELAEPTGELPATTAQQLLATFWVTVWSAPDSERREPSESERASRILRDALPLRTTDEARLN